MNERFQLEEVAQVVHNLANNKQTWSDIQSKFPKFEQQDKKT